MKIAHVSDLHIVSNMDNLKSIFLDFALLAGPPAAALPILSSIFKDEKRKQDLLDKLFYHNNSRDLDYRKIAALVAISAPAAYFIIRQLIRLKRIFYLLPDSENIQPIKYCRERCRMILFQIGLHDRIRKTLCLQNIFLATDFH